MAEKAPPSYPQQAAYQHGASPHAGNYQPPPSGGAQQTWQGGAGAQHGGGQAPYDPVRAGMEFQASLMAQCAHGNHQYKTDYGIVGIILAVVCFPCGLVALCVDKNDVCTRCGQRN